MSGRAQDAVGQGDADATVVLPMPGRRHGLFPSYLERPAAAADVAALGGLNPLLAAANPILAVVAQIRHALRHPDPAGLRASLLRQIDAFERSAAAARIPEDRIRNARFALSALLDDAAQATPWGREWSGERAFLAALGDGGAGGERFFVLLDALSADPASNADLLEFLFVCLALGFEGRYRGGEGGRQALAQIRGRLYALVERKAAGSDAELSARWRGAEVRARRLPGALAVWATASAALLLLAALYFGFSVSLGERSDPVAGALARIAPIAVAPPAHATPRPDAGALARALTEAIGRRDVEVVQGAGAAIIHLRGDELFAPGSARMDAALHPVVLRVAEALDGFPGPITVTGHTDDVPIRTARFPSNWELSEERARSVVALMAGRMRDAGRLRAEGLADSQPMAPNDSAANRARSRRVAIVVRPAP